jgi:NADH:ubiquinone oxidoreductase subunit F (NADH-binding)
MFARDDAVDRAKLEALLETLELGSLCAHGGGMPAPIRSLLKHFPDELGLAS